MPRGVRFAAAALAAAGALLAAQAQAARIEGQLSAHDGAKLAEPVSVQLFTYASGWQPGRSVKTDAEGRYAFEELSAPAVYWVSPTWKGVQYPGRVVEIAPTEGSATKTVDLPLYDHTDAGPKLSVTGLALVVEPEEAGVFRVAQEVYIENPEPVVIARKTDAAPVLKVGVAPDHSDLQVRLFPFLPVEFKDSGAELSIFGPIFPAQQVAQLEYRLTGRGGALETEIVLAEDVAEVRLLLPPAGFVADAPGLFPGPMDRDEESGALQHLTFRGFNLPAGTRLPLRLTPRETPAGLPTPAAVLLVTALFGVGALVVLRPALAGAKAAAPAAERGGAPEDEAFFRAVRDLQEDFELGKVSAEDRERMREDLRQEALRARARAAQPPPAARRAAAGRGRGAAAAPGPRCECGHAADPGARFCSACGQPLAVTPPPCACGHQPEVGARFCSACGRRTA